MKTQMLLWCMVLVQITISQSEIVGTYTTVLGESDVRISICIKNDTYYLSADNGVYVYMLGRSSTPSYSSSTDSSSSDNSDSSSSDDNILTVEFEETYQFDNTSTGVEKKPLSLTYNIDTNTYTLSNGFTVTLNKTNNESFICAAPTKNWNDVKVPLVTGSRLTATHFEIRRYESVTAEGGACWAVVESPNLETPFQGGSISMNVELLWDGQLRTANWNELNGVGACISGVEFDVWIAESIHLTTWQCPGFGTTYRSYADEYCSSLCGPFEDVECPIFDGSMSSARAVSSMRISDARAVSSMKISDAKAIINEPNKDNYNVNNNNNGEENVIINIKFSSTTYATLWSILTVFLLATVILCWCQNKHNNKEQNFEFPSSV